jgi:hypothetical protein
VSRARDLLAALLNANVGGFLTHPPGFDVSEGLGVAGIHGVPRARIWDAAASARPRDLTGDTVTFVVLPDGTIVVDDDVPNGSLEPLAEALEETLSPPYRAAAIRHEENLWTAVAEKVVIAEIPRLEGDTVDLTVVDGERTLLVDGERTIRPLPALDVFTEIHRDVSVRAERVDDDLFAVDVFPL